MVYTPKFLRLWSLKTWRENFLLLAWEVKNSRATTKKFRCHFWEKQQTAILAFWVRVFE